MSVVCVCGVVCVLCACRMVCVTMCVGLFVLYRNIWDSRVQRVQALKVDASRPVGLKRVFPQIPPTIGKTVGCTMARLSCQRVSGIWSALTCAANIALTRESIDMHSISRNSERACCVYSRWTFTWHDQRQKLHWLIGHWVEQLLHDMINARSFIGWIGHWVSVHGCRRFCLTKSGSDMSSRLTRLAFGWVVSWVLFGLLGLVCLPC